MPFTARERSRPPPELIGSLIRLQGTEAETQSLSKFIRNHIQSCHCIAALSFSTFGIEDALYNRKVADPNIMDLSSCWWSTEPDLCGGVCFYELVLTKIACWHLQCGPMGHFRGLGFRDLSWCGQFRFQMFHMIKDSKSGLPLKKRTMSRMSTHQNLCLNRSLHLLESLAGWWVSQKFPKIIKSSSRKYESFLKWPFGLRSGNAGHSQASGDSGGFGSVNGQHSKNRGSKTTA